MESGIKEKESADAGGFSSAIRDILAGDSNITPSKEAKKAVKEVNEAKQEIKSVQKSIQLRKDRDERGHTKTIQTRDAREKELLRIATRGVVRLFTAISASQKATKRGTDTSSNASRERKRKFEQALKKKEKADLQKDAKRSKGWDALDDSGFGLESEQSSEDEGIDPIRDGESSDSDDAVL